MTLLQGVLVVLEAVAASVLLPPMAWLLAKTYRRSAAGRRLVWITAFAMLLGLPLLALIAPSLTVLALPAPAPLPAAPYVAAVPAPDPAPGGFDWSLLILAAIAVWLAGLVKLGAEHLFALARLELMRRRATPWRGPTPVQVRGCALLMSEDCPGPMTWGVLRPVIMLPDEAVDWPADRLATVLRHEMAHVRRRDGLAQALAVIACALYWPNPLVWGAARALRREAELAADDAVIAAGVLPSDYAGQLLELAAEWRERRLTPTGLAMAAPPALSQRVQSILSTDAIRTGATAMDTWKLVLLGGVATAALTLARPSVAEVPAATAPTVAPPTQHLEIAASAAANADQATQHVEVRRMTLAQAQQRPATRQDIAAAPAPASPPAAAAPTALQPVLIPGLAGQVPYNPVTDDPASPGFIAAGQPGAGHPVPGKLAELLNARKDAGAPWTLSWIPNPDGALPPLPGAPGARIIGARMTPEQRAQLDRQTAAIGPAIDKAIKDAHIDEAVRKALAAEDAKTREEVAKQLQQIGPLIQRAIANAHVQEAASQRVAQLQERQVEMDERLAAQFEEQAKQARERAQRDRQQLNQAPALPALPAQPKN